MEHLRCGVVGVGSGHRVVVTGEIDVETARELAETLVQFVDGSVTVDLTGVTFMDSKGTQALIAAQRHIERRHRRFVVDGCSPPVLRVLRLGGLAELLHLGADDRFGSGSPRRASRALQSPGGDQ